nr:reverse transcriptase domain-containing protein [Tanacetum cinerariifolium]
ESSSNNSKHRNRIRSKPRVEPFSIPIVTMADNRTMEEMLQARTEGYGDAIVVPDILAENFEIKTGLLSLIQANQFHGFESNNPHDHIRSFNRITSTLKFRDVSNDAIKLMLFPYSLEEAAKICGWKYLEKDPRDALTIIENKSKVRYSRNKPVAFKVSTTSSGNSSSTDARIDKLTDTISNLIETFNKKMTTPAMVKAVEETCVICGGAHPYYDYIATDSNISSVCATTGTYTQGNTRFHPQVATNYRADQNTLPGFPPIQNNQNRYNQNQNQSYNQNRGNNYQALIQHPQVELPNEFLKYKQITETRPSVSPPPLSSKEVDREPETITDQVLTESTNNIPPLVVHPSPIFTSTPTSSSKTPEVTKDTIQPSTKNIQPPVTQTQVLINEPIVAPKPKPTIHYPSRANKQKLRKKDDMLALKSVEIFRNLHFELSFADALLHMPKFSLMFKKLTLYVDDEAITFKVGQTSKYSYNDAESINRVDIIDVACEEYVQEVLGFSDTSKSGNPTPTFDPIITLSSPSLTLFEGGEFILEETEACLTNESIPPGINDTDLDLEEDIRLLEELLNNDPSLSPLPSKELNVEEIKTVKSSIDEPPELKLKELPSHLEYEVIIILDAGLIYPIFDSPWVSPVHCVPKKGGMTVVKNEDNELIPTRLVTGWRVCIDYRKLNDATQKDHFSLPFMDQMLESLAGYEFYWFLDGFSKYFQIPIDPQDQEKTTFTCPYGTFAYRRMPFGLCNAPGTFQRCMMAIFHDMIEKTMEVFMDDFSVFSDSFSSCLSHLDKMLQMCEDTNLVLNWEKCHFMVKEGIVLGHKISKSGIEVDRAKVDVIAKLPHSNSVKGAVLGQRKTKHFQPIHYASKTMTDAQAHYTTTKKELLAVVYAFEKFRPYLVLSKTIVYTDHSALKYLLAKQDAKPRLLWWILLLQEFDVTICVKKGAENLTADHLSRLENPHQDEL